jgi:hypothetical protein
MFDSLKCFYSGIVLSKIKRMVGIAYDERVISFYKKVFNDIQK